MTAENEVRWHTITGCQRGTDATILPRIRESEGELPSDM